MAKKVKVIVEAQAPKVTSKQLVVYAAFDFGGRHYEEGDAFVPPSGLTVDPAFDQFRAVEKRRSGGKLGMAFYELGEVIDKKSEERNTYRHVLPVEEA